MSAVAESAGARTPAVRVLREATQADLAAWDVRTVDAPGGDVQQSLAWAAHRERTGWEAYRLLLDDGSAALVLGRRWRMLGGGRAYVPKGPVTAGASPEVVAERLAAVAAWVRGAGLDVLVADPEIPASTSFPALLARSGFRAVEEIGPSRHRVGVPIPQGADDETLLAVIARGTRQRFLGAERKGTRVVRYDCRPVSDVPGVETVPQERLADAAGDAFGRFHALLQVTGARRGFGIGDRPVALAWWRAALDAGHLVLLEARAPDDAYLGGAIFYRHGERLTYAHSGDVVALRHAHPGTVHLVLWRALQLTASEGRTELDLGGVDVRGARHEPLEGEPMYGLLEFKRSFGGRWVELSGAHERVLRRPRHGIASATQAAARAIRAIPGALGRRGGSG
jgi:hypothetical protein